MICDPKRYLRCVADLMAEEAESGPDFWAEHGMDREHGGIVTYLDRSGNWYLKEKQGWFTGRAMYAFARGYNDLCKKQRWLDAAENLYNFLVTHQLVPGENGKLYHYMDLEGNPKAPSHITGNNGPAIRPYLHDESFAVMGLAELYRATGREAVRQTLYHVFEAQQFLFKNPRYYIDGTLSPENTQPKVDLGTLMSLLCSAQTARACDPERAELYTQRIACYMDEVFRHYYDPERKLIHEVIMDCPGHGLEVAWFMLAEGLYTKNQELVELCADVILALFHLGWDKQYGGFETITNFVGSPACWIGGQLKYWWPNIELMIGLMYAYIGTGRQEFLEKYRMVHEWVFSRFPDREQGEWYGYLNRDGSVLSPCKGDYAKGPYHLYRGFYAIRDLILAHLEKNP